MKNFKKTLALGCSAALIVSTLNGCGTASDTETTVDFEEIAVIQSAVEEFEGVTSLVSHSDTAGKTETVYAILNSDGELEHTIVSEWLKNPKGSTSLADTSSLSDITVVKGSAEYSKEGTDQLTWTNDGSDIYYQGTSDRELPVEVHLSYELDGKKVTAEELSGASGHLKMTFTYDNHTAGETTIQGKSHTIYQPFVMISGMLLDNSKAQNITVDNGSSINSGDDTIVFGIAMPGLKTSLGLDEAKDEDGKRIDLDLPEEVCVEADVTDFSLMMTLTIASNSALSQFGLEDIDSIDDLKADMDQLTNGMDDLIDGAGKLNDGVAALKDGTGTLSSGAGELSSGVAALTQGAGQLSAGLDTLLQNNQALISGAASLSGGLSSLNASLTSEESKQKTAALISGSTAFSQGLASTSNGLDQILTGYDCTQGDLANLIAGLNQYAQGLASSGDAANTAYAGAIRSLISAYEGLYGQVSAVKSGVSTLSTSYADIHSGISTMAGSISEVSTAVSQLSDGANSLNAGITAYTSGVSQTSEGANTLASGLTTLNTQVPTLVNGISQLSDGVNELSNGTIELKDGVIRFNEEGIKKLADVIGNDLETYYDRLMAVKDYAEEYTSYAGCPNGTECSVKFIYKTDSIQ